MGLTHISLTCECPAQQEFNSICLPCVFIIEFDLLHYGCVVPISKDHDQQTIVNILSRFTYLSPTHFLTPLPPWDINLIHLPCVLIIEFDLLHYGCVVQISKDHDQQTIVNISSFFIYLSPYPSHSLLSPPPWDFNSICLPCVFIIEFDLLHYGCVVPISKDHDGQTIVNISSQFTYFFWEKFLFWVNY